MKRAGLALVLVSSAALAVPAPRMPGPARADYTRSTREAEDAKCVKCHARAAREHEASLHRASFTDEAFQRGYRIEPVAFCRSCHAPEARPDAEPDAFARDHGVSCVTCHVPEPGGAVLGKRAATVKSPHAITVVPDLGTRACTRCHEFAFPRAESLGDRGMMQRTASEHAASADKDRSCASCHMKDGHRMASLLPGSVEVSASRSADGEARFVLRAKGVGHAMPTGDLFRRLVLRVKTPRGTVERAFGRTFRSRRDDAGETVRYEASDTRLAPERSCVLTLPPGDATWELAYQRVTAVGQTPPFAVDVHDETVLARGAL